MALDPRVASILDRQQTSSHEAGSDDEDALIASLEEENEEGSTSAPPAFREQRIQQLHAELSRAKYQKASGFGTYVEIKDEKELMDLTTETRLAVVHFAKDDFARCGIMDGHLRALCKSHLATRFLKINVENCPFLVTKLKIQVLPCVIAFVDGVSADRIVGFEGLGYTADTFTTKDLETRLLGAGVLERQRAGNYEDQQPQRENANGRIRFGVKAKKNEGLEDDDEDWD